MLQTYTTTLPLNEFIEESKIRISSIMKQISNTIKNHSTIISTNQKTDLSNDDFHLICVLVKLLNAELNLYGSLKSQNIDDFNKFTTYVKFIAERYNFHLLENIYIITVEKYSFKIELNEDYMKNNTTYDYSKILDIKKEFNKISSNN